jgi:Icc protein
LRGTVTYSSLCDVLDHYRNQEWRGDLVLATGDLIQDDSAAAYAHFRDLTGSLGLPVYCLPGNHDIRSMMREALAARPFHYCAEIEACNWLVCPVDSCSTGHAGGRVPDDELSRLDASIDAAGAEHVMVAVHHPPVALGSRWLDSVGMQNGSEFLERIGRSGRVRLVVFGHAHQAFEAEHARIRIVGTPSTCRQFTPRSPGFAVDENPPAYRRICLYTDGRFEHELVWVK